MSHPHARMNPWSKKMQSLPLLPLMRMSTTRLISLSAARAMRSARGTRRPGQPMSDPCVKMLLWWWQRLRSQSSCACSVTVGWSSHAAGTAMSIRVWWPWLSGRHTLVKCGRSNPLPPGRVSDPSATMILWSSTKSCPPVPRPPTMPPSELWLRPRLLWLTLPASQRCRATASSNSSTRKARADCQTPVLRCSYESMQQVPPSLSLHQPWPHGPLRPLPRHQVPPCSQGSQDQVQLLPLLLAGPVILLPICYLRKVLRTHSLKVTMQTYRQLW